MARERDPRDHSPSAKRVARSRSRSRSPKHSPEAQKPWTYHPKVLFDHQCEYLYKVFSKSVTEINEKEGRPTITVFGEKVLEPRLKAYYAKTDEKYVYSGTEQKSHPFTPELDELNALAQALVPSGHTFERVLVNYYRDGKDRIGLHCDSDAMDGYIVSFTCYPPESERKAANKAAGKKTDSYRRKFVIKDKKGKKVDEIWMEQGSAIVMAPGMQATHKHEVPKTMQV